MAPGRHPRDTRTHAQVITPDGKTLIVAETFAERLTAFDVAPDGALVNRRLWADVGALGVPDGICLDDEGACWVAFPQTLAGGPGSIARVAEGGEVLEVIESAPWGVYACALGGPRGRTLFILEALSHAPGQTKPGNARIRTVEVDAPRAGGDARP